MDGSQRHCSKMPYIVSNNREQQQNYTGFSTAREEGYLSSPALSETGSVTPMGDTMACDAVTPRPGGRRHSPED